MPNERTELERIAARYAAFAEEARGWSGSYERLAAAVAGSRELLGFIASLPDDRRQPNLFLAAVRQVGGVPADGDQLAETVRKEHARIRAVMLSRTTQTNEPGRCAVLLPVLARLPQPLALLEVGAAAGLCLLPDRYGYDFGGKRIEPAVTQGGKSPVFPCKSVGPVPLPPALPEVAWRCGLDLTPIDLRAGDDVRWLETLVWPEQDDRLDRLRAAVEIARRAPPRVVKGDLLMDLDPLLATAPKGATLVVFHTAVLGYVASKAARKRFAASMLDAKIVWISNEAPGVFPAFAATAPPAPGRDRFLMCVNGQPLAWSGPHGQSLDWFGSLPGALRL